MEFHITTYTPALGEAIENLQRRYIAANPKGSKFVPKKFFDQHPAADGGRNVFCALQQDGKLMGYGALFPQPADPQAAPELPNRIWIHIRVEPDQYCTSQVQSAIYDGILDKSRQLAQSWSPRATQVAISYPEARVEEIEFFAGRGFQRLDALLQMQKRPLLPILEAAIPSGISIRRWAMQAEQDKLLYLAAAGQAFPQAPQAIADLEFYMKTWQGGMPLVAFDPQDRIAGGLMAFWYSQQHGVTEDIFVLPAWQRMGVARALIVEGLRYLAENQIEAANLEVKASNIPAVHLYQAMGYATLRKEEQWAITL